jgi:hypothetical protein
MSTRCSKKVYGGGMFKGSQCTKRATVTIDGKPYCTIHDPERVKRKNAERQARWLKERDVADAAYSKHVRIQTAEKAVIAKAEALVAFDGHYSGSDALWQQLEEAVEQIHRERES